MPIHSSEKDKTDVLHVNKSVPQPSEASLTIADNRPQTLLQRKFLLQRMKDDEEDVVQEKASPVQKTALPEDEEESLKSNVSQPKTIQQQKEKTPSPNTTGLPDNLKTGIENLSGFSLDNVQVHYNSNSPAQLHALAYTQGTDIHVASGQERHLPHEAWHVVQQMQGRVEPTLRMNGDIPINDDSGLEHEADVMGNRVL
jgi:hypothetical protein